MSTRRPLAVGSVPPRALALLLAAACGSRTALRVPDAGGGASARPEPGLRRPRPVAPISTAYVTTQRPTLEWRLPTSATSARVELSREPSFGRGAVAHDVEGTTWRSREPLEPGVWFWRVRPAGEQGPLAREGTATWEFRVPRRDTGVDSTTGLFIDVNRDGMADVLIGTFTFIGLFDAPGVAEVRLGSRAGPGRVVHRVEQAGNGGSTGEALPTYLGDVNGDGFGDVLVQRRPGQPSSLYSGTASGLEPTPMMTFAPEGPGLTAAGDLDRDGYSDALVWNAYGTACAVLRGGPSGLTCDESWVQFPRDRPLTERVIAVGAPGDVDGDGVGDLVMTWGDGVTFRWRGVRDGRPRLTAPLGLGEPRTAPTRLAGPGDIDGDGRSDFVLYRASWTSAILVGLGQPGDAPPRIVRVPEDPPPAIPERFVGRAGDLDGDGFADVALFPLRNVSAGDVSVLRGGPDGLARARVRTLRAAETGVARSDRFGFSVASPGDIDGDGFDDLVVGQPDEGAAANSVVHVYRGGVDGPGPRPAWTLRAEGVASGFGAWIASPDQQAWY